MNNDLIRKFEKQCWNHQANCVDTEKFAELIIQECAMALDKTIAPANHPMNNIGWKLKQYFGVEK